MVPTEPPFEILKVVDNSRMISSVVQDNPRRVKGSKAKRRRKSAVIQPAASGIG